MRFVANVIYAICAVLTAVIAAVVISGNSIPELIFGALTGSQSFLFFVVLAIISIVTFVFFALFARSVRPWGKVRLLLPGAALILLAVSVFQYWSRPYSEEFVSFRSGDIAVAATLYLPAVREERPAIVIVHGSAPFRRAFYDAWARRYAAHGYVVLLADKRGVGETGGIYDNENNTGSKNLHLLATDVSAAVDYLDTRAEVDGKRIGLVGLSQGGWTAPIAAAANPKIAFMMFITGPTVSVGEESEWSNLRGDYERDAATSVKQAEQRMAAMEPSGFDPRSLLSELNISGFWLFGDTDESIPSKKSIAVLDRLIKENHKPYRYQLYRGYGHILIGKGAGGAIPDIAPQSWEDSLRWLDETTASLGTSAQ